MTCLGPKYHSRQLNPTILRRTLWYYVMFTNVCFDLSMDSLTCVLVFYQDLSLIRPTKSQTTTRLTRNRASTSTTSTYLHIRSKPRSKPTSLVLVHRQTHHFVLEMPNHYLCAPCRIEQYKASPVEQPAIQALIHVLGNTCFSSFRNKNKLLLFFLAVEHDCLYFV